MGARHVSCFGASYGLDESSNEARDSRPETELSLDERLKSWIRRSLHRVYGERESLSENTPFDHAYWGQHGGSCEQFIIPTRLDPERNLASLNRELAKGWFVVKVSHEDAKKRFWKCQGPLMGKDVYLPNRNIIGKEGRQPSLGDFLFARIQVRMHFKKSADSGGYGPVLVLLQAVHLLICCQNP